MDSLKPRIPAPRERPSSGRRLAPNTSSSRTNRKAMWRGLSSPSMALLRSGWVYESLYEASVGSDHSSRKPLDDERSRGGDQGPATRLHRYQNAVRAMQLAGHPDVGATA